jgi:hypothetical protein
MTSSPAAGPARQRAVSPRWIQVQVALNDSCTLSAPTGSSTSSTVGGLLLNAGWPHIRPLTFGGSGARACATVTVTASQLADMVVVQVGLALLHEGTLTLQARRHVPSPVAHRTHLEAFTGRERLGGGSVRKGCSSLAGCSLFALDHLQRSARSFF